MTMSNLDLIEKRIKALDECRTTENVIQTSFYIQGLINGLKLAEDWITPKTEEEYKRLNKDLDDQVTNAINNLTK